MTERGSVRPSALLDLRMGGDDTSFTAVVSEQLCVGRTDHRFLFGGIALAACIEAMELRTGIPAIYASAQFFTAARADDLLRFDTIIAANGRSVRQCGVEMWCGKRLIMQMHSACGQKGGDIVHQQARMPPVPPPQDCPERSVARLLSSNIQSLFEFRLACGELPDRAGWISAGGVELACWIRPRDGMPIDRRLLAVIADCAALVLPSALGRPASGSSLDNMIRFLAKPEGEYVLAVMRVDGTRDGLAHISIQMFSPSGTLLASASQSMLLR